ncbi:MAG: hypothetical protein ABI321_06680, partial [Polyangia bacterium]
RFKKKNVATTAARAIQIIVSWLIVSLEPRSTKWVRDESHLAEGGGTLRAPFDAKRKVSVAR